MADLILGSEISEFVANRQYAKIQYLQQENEQLQEQLRDFDKALKLNKDIIRLAFDATSNINNSNNSTNASNESIQQKQLLLKLHEENEVLRTQLKKLQEERNLAQNKVLLQQQISEENQAFYKDLIQEQEEKLQELRRCIQDKEYTIQDIEKNRGIVENGQMIKIREIVTPNEQTLRLHEELESTRQILNKLSQESQSLQEQNTELKDQNFNFKRELIKLRIVHRSPVAYYKMKEFIYDDNQGIGDEDLALHSEIYANMGFLNVDANPPQYNHAFQQSQQQQNLKYLTNNERQIYQEKLQKSESLLKGFRELFEREKNKSALLIQQVDELCQKLQESYNSNQILINSNKLKDQKMDQLLNDLQYYRTQYGNYIYLLKNKRKANLNLSFDRYKTLNCVQQSQKRVEAPVQKKQQHDKQQIEEDQEDIQINVSILEEKQNLEIAHMYSDADHDKITPLQQNPDDEFEEHYRVSTPNKKPQRKDQYQMNMLECKQFLLNSAKELYMEYNLRMNNLQRKQLMDPQKWSKQRPIWHQKSSSDPLDYFTLNFQDFQFSEMKQFGHLDDRLNRGKGGKKTKNDNENPFQIDFSVINPKNNNNPKKVVQAQLVQPNQQREEKSFYTDDGVLQEMQN
ncbi:hypothetical protein pb186bvf_006831 [Paramecium bursaria]